MGCSGSNIPAAMAPSDHGFSAIMAQFSGNIFATSAIKAASTKAFAGLLSKYPALKETFQVPEHAKSETDLVNTQAVKDASETFLGHYADIAKNTGNNAGETIRKKAAEFTNLGIQPAHIKTYGENLVQNVMKDANSKLTSGEEAGLKLFTDHVSNKLTTEMGGANNA